MIKQFIDSMESRPFSMFPEFEEGSSTRGLFNSAVGFDDLPSFNSSKSLSSSASGTTSCDVNAKTASCDLEMSDEREQVANEVIPPALIYNDNNVSASEPTELSTILHQQQLCFICFYLLYYSCF